jgi:cell division protein FtsL
VVIAWSSLVFHEASRILIDPLLGYSRLVFTIIVSIIWSVLAVLVTSLFHKKYADLFGEEEEPTEKEKKVEEP